MTPYRVIQWGVGYVGTYSLRYVLTNPNLKLVGLRCYTDRKKGKDAGELAGLGTTTGIEATCDTAALLRTEADCVLYMPRDPLHDPSIPGSPSESWVPEMIAILESGKDVITPIATMTHWRHLKNGTAFRDRLNDACRKGDSTVFFSGFDPGYMTDYLAFTMAGVVGNIEQIRTWEILDYGSYPEIPTLQCLGFGLRPEQMNAEAGPNLIATWGGAIHLLAESLGFEVDDIALEHDLYLAPHTFTAQGGMTIEKGTIGGLRFKIAGKVAGTERISINHVTRMSLDMAPNWPKLGRDGGYKIEIDAYPPFVGEFPMGLPGGAGYTFADAMIMTAGRCVNAIDVVNRAPAGYRTYLDLPPIGGKHALAFRRRSPVR